MACADLSLEDSSIHGCHANANGKQKQTFQRTVFISFLGGGDQEILKKHPPFLLNSAKLRPVLVIVSTSVYLKQLVMHYLYHMGLSLSVYTHPHCSYFSPYILLSPEFFAVF